MKTQASVAVDRLQWQCERRMIPLQYDRGDLSSSSSLRW